MKVKTKITVTSSNDEVQPEAIETPVEVSVITKPEQEVKDEQPAMEPSNDKLDDDMLVDAETPEGAVMDSAKVHENGDMTLAKGDETIEVPADAVVIPDQPIESVSDIPATVTESEVSAEMTKPEAVSEESAVTTSEPEPAKPEFDEAAYLAAYPDVQQAVVQGHFKSGLDHYQKHGKAEGR